MKLTKRARNIGIGYLFIAFPVLFISMAMTAKSLPAYPQHSHPFVFILIQRIVNFPLPLLASFFMLMIMHTFQIEIGINAIFAVIVASIFVNGTIWGYCLDKLIVLLRKEKR